MANIVGSLQVVLGLDSAEFVNGLSKADAVSASFAAKQERNAKAIDKIVGALEKQVSYLGKTEREIKLLQLTQRGATEAQLQAADAALRAGDAYRKQAADRERLNAQEKASKGDAEKAARSIDATVAALQLQAQAYGKTAGEVKLLELAQKGATQTQLAAASAAIKAGEGASAQAEKIANERAAADAAKRNSEAIDKMVLGLQREVQAVGKTASELRLLELAHKGASEAQLKEADATLKALSALERQAAVAREAADGKRRTAEAAEAYVLSLQKEVAFIGKSADEIKLLELAQRGATQADLAAVEAQQRLAKIAREQHAVKEQLAADERAGVAARQANNQSIEASIVAYQRQADAVGKTERELALLALAEKGATQSQLAQADAVLRNLEASKSAAKAAQDQAVALQRAEREAKRGVSTYYQFAAGQKLTALQMQQVSYQLNDFFVQIASGQSPILALIQQGSQLNGQFGSIGGTFRALASVFTATRVVIGGLVGAVVGLVAAYAAGAQQSADFATQMTLTGGAAAITEGQFNRAAESISHATETTIGSSRETLQSLVSTGRFSGQVLIDAGRAVQGLAKVTGDEAKTIIANFVSMADGVANGADSLNKKYHLLTAEQLKYIKTLEDQGKSQEALSLVFGALNARIDETIPRMGTLEGLFNRVKQAASGIVDTLKGIGRAGTNEDFAEGLRSEIALIDRRAKAAGGLSPVESGFRQKLADELVGIQKRQKFEIDINLEKQRGLQIEEAVSKFNKSSEQFATNKLKREKEIAEAKAQAAQSDGKITPAMLKTQISNINEKYKDTKGSSGQGEANRTQRELRDADIKNLQDFYARQKITIDYANKYLDTQYQIGLLSLDDYYKQQDALRAEELQKQTANLDAQIAVDKKFAAQSTGSRKLDFEGKAKDAEYLKAQAIEKSVQEQKNLELQRGEAVHQAQLRYQELLATVKELSGDLEGASKIRIAAQVEEAAKVIKAVGGDASAAKTLSDKLTKIQELSKVQTDYNALISRQQFMEESLRISADVSGTSEIEIMRKVGDLRRGSIKQLEDMTLKAQELATTLGTPEAIQFAQQLSLALQQANKDIDPVLTKIRDMGKEAGDAIANGFADAIFEGKKLKDVINDVGKAIFNMVTNEVFTKPLGNFFSNAINGTGSSAGSGISGLIGSGLNALLGGFGGGGAGLFTAGGTQGMSWSFPKAAGGWAPANTMQRVNERGPELLDVNGKEFLMMGSRGGNVMTGGRQGSSVNVTVNQSFAPGTTAKTTLQAASEIRRTLELAQRNM